VHEPCGERRGKTVSLKPTNQSPYNRRKKYRVDLVAAERRVDERRSDDGPLMGT
jgi:rRNA maturation protein Nop10